MMTSPPGRGGDGVRHTTVFADYGQFRVQDAEAHNAAMRSGAAIDPDRPAGGWTDEAVQRDRIGIEPHSISIGTARTDFVETVLGICHDAPARIDEADHVVEADLDVTTGTIFVLGCVEPPSPDKSVDTEPGLYRVRVSYVPAASPPSADPDVDGDHFSYVIELWPSQKPTAVSVVVQGPHPWAS